MSWKLNIPYSDGMNVNHNTFPQIYDCHGALVSINFFDDPNDSPSSRGPRVLARFF